MYSNVVASRPASPLKESDCNDPVVGQKVEIRSVQPVMEHQASTYESDDSEVSQIRKQYVPVKRRRAQSLDSLKKGREIKKEIFLTPSKLSSEQKTVVKAATKRMIEEQKAHEQRQQETVQSEQQEPISTRNKGKGIDPREWGNIEISEKELVPHTQEALLQGYKAEKEKGNHNRDPKYKQRSKIKRFAIQSSDSEIDSDRNLPNPEFFWHRSIASAGHSKPLLRASSRPATQINPSSSLGIALGEVAIRHKEDDYDSSPSSSSDSENSENYTSNDTSHKKKHRSKKKKVRHHKKPLKKEDESIKPIPPKEYSGKVDIRSYQRFIMESEAYLRDGKVRKE